MTDIPTHDELAETLAIELHCVEAMKRGLSHTQAVEQARALARLAKTNRPLDSVKYWKATEEEARNVLASIDRMGYSIVRKH